VAIESATALLDARIARALALASGQFAVLIDADLRVSWQSETTRAYLGQDVVGLTAMDMLHPDDLELAASGLAHLSDRAEAFSDTYDPMWRPGDAIVRLAHADGTWRVFEGTAFNFLADPEVAGLLIVCRPKRDVVDLVTVIDLLGAEAPLERVLPAIAQYVDHSVDTAQTAIVWWDEDEEHVSWAVDAPEGPAVPREVVDRARSTAAVQRVFAESDVERLGGSRGGAIIAMPVLAPGGREVMACIVVWSPRPIEQLDRPQRPIHQAVRLVSLAVVDHFSKTALRWEASHDSLTGLLNRSGFDEKMQAVSGGGALLYLDLDDFKPVNDSIGHAGGDEVLRVVARRIETAVRGDDFVGRIGGDEFAVICPDMNERIASAVADRLVEAIGRPISVSGQTVRIGASIGVVAESTSIGRPETLGWADVALYQAKAAGKSAVVVACPELRD
jgi:diguanylate cyclase (GGDEF)-like protein